MTSFSCNRVVSILTRQPRRRLALWAGMVIAGCAPARAEVGVSVELSGGAAEHRLYWAIKQSGRIVAGGALDCPSVGTVAFSAPALDGPATVHVSINRDDYESPFPSFGDLFQRVSVEVVGGDLALALSGDDWRERRLSDRANLLTVHYHRFDGDYDNVGLWTWDQHDRRHPAEQEAFPVGHDDYGAVFQLDLGEYGQLGERVGLLPRRNSDWQFKDGRDRFWSADMGPDVWLVQDDDRTYASRPDTTPKLVAAMLETETTVVARFTHSLPVVDFPLGRFTIRREDGTTAEIDSVTPQNESGDKANAYRVHLAGPLDFLRQAHDLLVTGFSSRRIALGGVLVNTERYNDPAAVLGARYSREATTFGMFSPVARNVEVVIADNRTGGDSAVAHAMTVNDHGIWSATVPGDHRGRFYAYRLGGPGLDPASEVTDIYAVCATGRGGRAMIVDLDRTNPPGFEAGDYARLDSPVDAIIYEMHVRDFTIAANSGVERKGKFLGLTESGTHLVGDPSVKTGLDHLVELGVTHVQIMPIQDFANTERPDGTYNWGYMPVFFNSPDGWYATVPVGPRRISEFKRVVHALHQRGIGAIMDVVYNHAADHASFERLVPGYYFRRKPDGSLWNGSGCGNELASEHPMARKFMLDSVKYWVSEYGIDGFRFDLMGLHDLETMMLIRGELEKIDPSILVYGEPWTGGASGLKRITDKSRVAGTGVAAFNDHFRDAIKGDRDGGGPGFIQAGDRIDGIRQGIRGAVGDWAKQPTDCITYCACHDNLTTWDKIVQSAPDVTDDVRKRMQRLAGLLVLTSQGISFIQGGQEFCRSKGGSHNSYNLPDSVNRIDWSLKKRNRDVFDYYRGLIALRKAHAGFRLRTAQQVRKRIRFLDSVPHKRCLAYTIDAVGLPDAAYEHTLLLLNGSAAERTFRLPPGRWRVLVDADRAGVETLAEVEGTADVEAHTGMVLVR